MSFRYLLDANAYIQAKNLHYRMEVVPGFWDWLDLQMDKGVAGTIDGVFEELTSGTDNLAGWASDRRGEVLSVADSDTQGVFTEIANHVMNHEHYAESHATNFLSGADPWLIAKATVTGAIVVTHEIKAPKGATKVKIPNVCEEFGVQYCSTFDLMGELSARLVLEPHSA